MAKCGVCGKGGIFTKMTDLNMCSKCDAMHGMEIISTARVVVESMQLACTTKKIDTRISRINVTIKNCERLKQFELRGANFRKYFKETTAMEISKLLKDDLQEIEQILNDYRGKILGQIVEVPKTKKQIQEAIPNDDMEYVKYMLDLLVNEGSIEKFKDGRSYKYKTSNNVCVATLTI